MRHFNGWFKQRLCSPLLFAEIQVKTQIASQWSWKKKANGVTGISSRKCPSAKREEDMNKRWPCTAGSSPLLKWVSTSRNMEAWSISKFVRMRLPDTHVIYNWCPKCSVVLDNLKKYITKWIIIVWSEDIYIFCIYYSDLSFLWLPKPTVILTLLGRLHQLLSTKPGCNC